MTDLAIVLLGYSGVGKDTLFKEFDKKYSNVHNAKFSLHPKSVVADLVGVDLAFMEDRNARKTLMTAYGLSPLDLLNALFCYADNMPEFVQRTIDLCINSIPENKVPVFTDIRRSLELYTVCETYEEVLVFRLYREGIQEGATDGELKSLVSDFEICMRGTPEESMTSIQNYLPPYGLEPRKPKYFRSYT